jgi:hypothetical protein
MDEDTKRGSILALKLIKQLKLEKRRRKRAKEEYEKEYNSLLFIFMK